MKIHRAYKIELEPNNKQKTAFLQHAGLTRFVYNWGLKRRMDAYRQDKKHLNMIDLSRELTKLKKTDFPWIYQTSASAAQSALRNLDSAFRNFFDRCKKGARKKGFPKFKSKKRTVKSFRLYNNVHVSNSHTQLPRIGKIRLKDKEYFPLDKDVKIISATVSEHADKWFVSINVEEEINNTPKIDGIVGVDVGIKNLAVMSDGEIFDNPKALHGATKRLRVRQKEVSRRKKDSCNQKKSIKKLARLHYRIFCVRRDAIHKATSVIAKSGSIIVLESLGVKNMMKNHCIAKSLGDASIGEIHRQLKYKVPWNGGIVIEADRWFPSSKMCSGCGNIKEMPLKEREYNCSCGFRIDRDLNAALNLKRMAGDSSVTACCPGSAGRAHKGATKLLAGQELSTTSVGRS